MMQELTHFVREIIQQHGYVGIFSLTTLEQFIFPVPADVFIAMGTSVGLPLKIIMIYVLAGALLGSFMGYFLGKYLGHPIMEWLFGKEKLDKGELFIKKYGVWGIIVAGLTPIPFKIVTWTAGIFEMPIRKYALGVILGRMPRYIIAGYAANWFFTSKFYASYEMSAIMLGVLQGVSEFLPISSSGHLVIMEHFINLPDSINQSNMVVFDIFLHGGSLLAILIYFWKDWIKVLKGVWKVIITLEFSKENIAIKLALATVPAIIAGLTFGNSLDVFRQFTPVGIAFILVGFFFLYVERKSKNNHIENAGLKKAIIIGMSQSLALIPGVSRAGSTIGTGMLLGLKREAAARFSFLLGGITILAANVYGLISIQKGATIPDASFTIIGTLTSFIVSLGSIHFLLKYLQKHTLKAFSAYLIIAGSVILAFL